MDNESLLTMVRLALHLATFLIIAAYSPDGETRYRAGISLFAACFAGVSLASAAQIVTQWGETCQQPQVWQTLFSAFVFVAVAYTRGNVAKLLPRLKWNHHS